MSSSHDNNDLAIPEFLRKHQTPKETIMSEPIDESKDLTLEEIMEKIKEMSEKKDNLTAAIAKFKKTAQRMIGSM